MCLNLLDFIFLYPLSPAIYLFGLEKIIELSSLNSVNISKDFSSDILNISAISKCVNTFFGFLTSFYFENSLSFSTKNFKIL
jgi:hypothetical protein